MKIFTESNVRDVYDRLVDFVESKGAEYIWSDDYYDSQLDEIGFDIIDGDWKHDHIYFKNLIKEFMDSNNLSYKIYYSDEIEESDQDTFSAHYIIEMNDERNPQDFSEQIHNARLQRTSKDRRETISNILYTANNGDYFITGNEKWVKDGDAPGAIWRCGHEGYYGDDMVRRLARYKL